MATWPEYRNKPEPANFYILGEGLVHMSSQLKFPHHLH